jgi:hypothetical protein
VFTHVRTFTHLSPLLSIQCNTTQHNTHTHTHTDGRTTQSVLHRPTWGDAFIRYPPYTESKIKWIKRLNTLKFSQTKFLVTAAMVGGAILAYNYGIAASL